MNMSTTTNTPRTDAAKFFSSVCPPEYAVAADFARTLERELSAAKQQIKDDNKSYGCELRDPYGTIWEQAMADHARAVAAETQLTKLKTEIEKGGIITEDMEHLIDERDQLRAEAKAQGEHAVAMTELAQSWKREAETAQTERDRLQGEVDKLRAIKAVIDVPPQTIGDGTSAGPLSVFARGWNGYINTLREMHPAIQFREGCIDTSGRFHGDMTMADVNAYLRAVCAIHKSFCDEALTLCEDTGIAANIIAKMRDLRSAAIEEAMQAQRA